jgi:peptidyl-prolyl cis-trans isomerase A (cyclophilin A)
MMTKMTRRALSFVGMLSLAACSSSTADVNPALLNPDGATDAAPDSFFVRFETTAGGFSVSCTRAWAPNGVDRFYNLVRIGFFDDVAFFRVVREPVPFVAQFGIHGVPAVAQKWANANIPPDLPTQTNARGTLTFAMAESPGTRSTQLFFNYSNNRRLDTMGFAPVCAIVGEGMTVVDKLYSGYGESITDQQGRIMSRGNGYLKQDWPQLDYIKTARIEDPPAPAASVSASGSTAPLGR